MIQKNITVVQARVPMSLKIEVESILEEMGLTLSDYLRLSMKQLTQNPQITLMAKKRYFSLEQEEEIEASLDEIESKTDMLTLKTDDDIEEFFTRNF